MGEPPTPPRQDQHGRCVEIIVGIAEKPSIAKRIARILADGAISVKRSVSKYNPIYNFSLNGEQFALTSVLGHIYETDFPQAFNNWRRVNPRTLLGTPLRKKVIQKAVANTVKAAVQGAETLIVMSDNDREGENIGMQIVRIARRVTPTLRIKRMRFSAVTPEQIWTAYRNLDKLNPALSNASEARQEVDLRLGAAFTRLATLSVQQRIPSGVISIGPVQTPTLGLVVKRWETIHQFQPEPFWYLVALVRIGSEQYEARWAQGRVFQKAEAEHVFTRIQAAKTALVTHVISKTVHKPPPPPLNTVALTAIAAKALGLASQATMDIAEALYNTGWISYPRTETEIYPESLDLKALLTAQARTTTAWAAYAAKLLRHPLVPTTGKRDDKAHPPIHPVNAAPTRETLAHVPELKKYLKAWHIYELVTRHFLATLSPPATILVGKVVLEIASVPFLLRGRMLVAPGYLHIYPYERLREKFLPALSEGMELEVAAIQLREDKTRPPSPYTEPELIKTMDRRGLGTDATISQHIATNVKRGYFTISPKRVIHPTARGIALIQSLEQSVAILVAPKIRAAMERQIMTIQTGKKAYKAVVHELRRQIRQMYDQFATNIGSFATKLVQEQQATHSPSLGQRTRRASVPQVPTSTLVPRIKRQRTSTPRSGSSPSERMPPRSGRKEPSDLSSLNLPSRVKPNSHQRVGTCPKCEAETLFFAREVTRWLGCAAYPACQWAFPLPASSKGELYLLPTQQCPLCRDLLLVYERKDGKSFKICAKCGVWCWKCPDIRTCPVGASQ